MHDEDDHAAFLKKPLTREDIEQLADAKLIPRQEALGELRHSVEWTAWIRRWLEALGSIFLMAGILFFFAHNWKEMSPLVRFTILEVGVLGAVVAALFAGIQKPAGQWLISGACVLTGVLIAVFGQVYQTGADAFEVFAMWAGLILVWVAVAKFAPLWVFWLVVAETAIVLFGGQVLVPDGIFSWPIVFLGLGIFTAIALFVFEIFQEKQDWIRQDWIRIALFFVTIFWLSACPWRWIFDFGYPVRKETTELAIGSIFWLAACGIAGWFYFKKRPFLPGISACILSPAVIAVFWVAKTILDDQGWEEAIGFLSVGILSIGIFSLASWLIIYVGKQLKTNS